MTKPDFVREFLYVDVDRVRSLLAQIEGGVVSEIRSHGGHVIDATAKASFFGIGAEGGYQHERFTEESRSLQDLTFVAFEEAAEHLNLIMDLTGPEYRDPNAWQSGLVHVRLRQGELVRIDAPVQLLDGQLFRSRIERFTKMADTIVEISGGLSGLKGRQLTDARKAAKSTIMGGVTDEYLDAISGFVESFLGDSIALRVMPCGGDDNLDLCFSGALLNRLEYIQQEREHLFSRYGAAAGEWTAVLQVAALPAKATGETTQSPDEDPNGGIENNAQQNDASDDTPESSVTDAQGHINRSAMEKMAIGLMQMMEQIGIVEGPRWPSISVAPLGVYRKTSFTRPQPVVVQETSKWWNRLRSSRVGDAG